MSIMSGVTRKLATSPKTGVVISAGKMHKAVTVRIAGQVWNKQIQKFYPSSKTYLVADPNTSLREGDVIRIASGWRVSKRIHHVVSSIVAPFGPPVNERPPVPTEEERLAQREKDRIAKDVRQAAKGRRTAILRLKEWEKMEREIPDLEAAMEKARIQEKAEEARLRDGKVEKVEGGKKVEKVAEQNVDEVVEEKTQRKPTKGGRRKNP